jgi:hypothetical protein
VAYGELAPVSPCHLRSVLSRVLARPFGCSTVFRVPPARRFRAGLAYRSFVFAAANRRSKSELPMNDRFFSTSALH